ncbi:MAG: hypothetical protein WBF21_19845 [Steroidobacteraceae bacterium]
MPRAFRGERPEIPLPGDVHQYRGRSVVEEYRPLAIVFAILALALTAYFIKSVLYAPKRPLPPVQSVYVEAVAPQATPAPDPAKAPAPP